MAAQTSEKTVVPPMERRAADLPVKPEDDGEGREDDGEGRPAVKMRTADSVPGNSTPPRESLYSVLESVSAPPGHFGLGAGAPCT